MKQHVNHEIICDHIARIKELLKSRENAEIYSNRYQYINEDIVGYTKGLMQLYEQEQLELDLNSKKK